MNKGPLIFGLSVLALALSIMAGTNVWIAYRFVYAPLRVVSTKVLTKNVKFGEPLLVEHVYDRRAYCKVDIDRFIIRLPDELLVRRERLPAGTTQIGVYSRVVMIPTRFPSQTVIPLGIADPAIADLVIGTCYRLREFIHSDCGDRLHTEPVPDGEFCVTE